MISSTVVEPRVTAVLLFTAVKLTAIFGATLLNVLTFAGGNEMS